MKSFTYIIVLKKGLYMRSLVNFCLSTWFHVYLHRMPSIASCWMNLMLDSLTSAPVDSTKESPLFFFSITTSSGSPKPDTQETQRWLARTKNTVSVQQLYNSSQEVCVLLDFTTLSNLTLSTHPDTVKLNSILILCP